MGDQPHGEPVALGMYRHYKGGVYELHETAMHSETSEQLAVYSGSDGRWWVRPLGMFTASVIVDGAPVPRFTYLGSSAVTLEEMTRRRDGWRQRWDKTDRELMAALARERLLKKQLQDALGHTWTLEMQLGAAQRDGKVAAAEARRYAEECGRLRDRLAQAEGWPDE